MKGRAALLVLLAALVLGAAAPSVALPAADDACADGGEAEECEAGCALCYCCPRAPTSSADDVVLPLGEAPSAGVEPEPPAHPPGPPARELLHVPWPRPA